MQRTIGLDFGTHQTKICVEEKDRLETKYSFITFKDNKGNTSYVLPSIIKLDKNERLTYGFIDNGDGIIIRYFKQATFTENPAIWKHNVNAEYYTIWYLAYILFQLEDEYGTDFSLNFGIPTDNDRYSFLKKKAISLICSAYRLVEEVYDSMDDFLNESIVSLMEKTEIVPYSADKKEEYGILVFPEAYACLRPLVSRGRITTGMNLMIDIGGGTTDISFFTMEKEKPTDKTEKPQIYELISVPMGLNFLTKAEENLDSGKLDSNVDANTSLDWMRQKEYINEITNTCNRLRQKILSLFRKSTKLYEYRVNNALKNRPVIFTGGGSTFATLRREYGDFSDIKHITIREWGAQSFEDMEDIVRLCPILSTVFGLSISATTDKFKTKPLSDLFIHLKDAEEEDEEDKFEPRSRSYKDDWMNKEYGVLNYGSGSSSPKKKKNKPTPAPSMTRPIISTPRTTSYQAQTPVIKKPVAPVVSNGDIPFSNMVFSDVDRKHLESHDVHFTLGDGSKVACKCFGKAIINNGSPFDIYYDGQKNLIIDALFLTSTTTDRRSFIAVRPSSPLYKAVESYGIGSINMIQGNSRKEKKFGKNVRVGINVTDPQSKKKIKATFKLTSSL